MGNFTEHIQQANNNLDFLCQVNNHINDRWDWQVTVCFYSAVHLINAHIVHKTNKNYLSHNQVSELINPYNLLSVAKLDERTYSAYNKLHQLSRRARYLLNENFKKQAAGIVEVQVSCLTYDKHFRKSIAHLNCIMDFMKAEHKVSFNKRFVSCIELNGLTFSNFSIK